MPAFCGPRKLISLPLARARPGLRGPLLTLPVFQGISRHSRPIASRTGCGARDGPHTGAVFFKIKSASRWVSGHPPRRPIRGRHHARHTRPGWSRVKPQWWRTTYPFCTPLLWAGPVKATGDRHPKIRRGGVLPRGGLQNHWQHRGGRRRQGRAPAVWWLRMCRPGSPWLGVARAHRRGVPPEFPRI